MNKPIKSVLFEGTPVVFTPLNPKGKHPELVVVDLRDLIKASKRHRKELSIQKKEIMTKLVTMSDTNCKIDLDQAIKAIK